MTPVASSLTFAFSQWVLRIYLSMSLFVSHTHWVEAELVGSRGTDGHSLNTFWASSSDTLGGC